MNDAPSTSYTVLTKNPVHEVKNMSWKFENALTTLDSTHAISLPLPASCPIKISLLVKIRRLDNESAEVSVGLQRADKKRNVSIQMTYDLKLANQDSDIYAKKKAVVKLDCGNPAPCFVLSAKFTSSSIGGTNNDPDCIRLDTTILMELATKNLFVLNEKQEIFFLLPGNVLFVAGDFFVVGCCTMTSSLPDKVANVARNAESKEGWKLFVQDLKVALDEGAYSDIHFKITDEQDNVRVFKLHKFILSARSPSFRRYLEGNDCLEIPLKVSNIAIFEILVNYLYSGDLDPLDDLWSYLRLYVLARDFEVEPLQKECIKKISKLISGDEVWGVLEVAVDLKDQVLQDLTCNYIADNHSVLESERFDEFVETKKELAAKVLKSIITKRKGQ